MTSSKQDIISLLQKEMLLLQGFKSPKSNEKVDFGLGPIAKAFPNASFPMGAVHEFISGSPEDHAATSGFLTGLLAGMVEGKKVCVWISNTRQTLFPPGLQTFGIAPDQIIFIELRRQQEALWAMEEALKCEGLGAVVGEIPDISFLHSRRLQLAVEKTRVTGFLLRHCPRQLNTTACIARWKITALPAEAINQLPGMGYPRWQVTLLRIRNGKPGSWQIEWRPYGFQPVYKAIPFLAEQQKKKAI